MNATALKKYVDSEVTSEYLLVSVKEKLDELEDLVTKLGGHFKVDRWNRGTEGNLKAVLTIKFQR